MIIQDLFEDLPKNKENPLDFPENKVPYLYQLILWRKDMYVYRKHILRTVLLQNESKKVFMFF